MVRILHISDPHGQSEVMANLEKLAWCVDVDVVAYTGDSSSNSCPQLPKEWNAWPQSLKLAVPGEHCKAGAHVNLRTWTTVTPWARVFEDLLFVGIDSVNGFRRIGEQIWVVDPEPTYSGVVILSHHRPMGSDAEDMASALLSKLADRPFLLLHGHEHGGVDMEAPEWEPGWMLGRRPCARSKVISCARQHRGAGAIISWNGTSFSWRSA